jgi:hypothetical protein
MPNGLRYTEWARTMMDSPRLLFVICLAGLWLSARMGTAISHRRGPLKDDERKDLDMILGATLTLLGLIIGFSFSMAVSRYDQRKNYEEEEANAIGTEYARAGLLPEDEARTVQGLLQQYLHQRILFYVTGNVDQLKQINVRTSALQNELWSHVQNAAKERPTPILALVVGGMNDVLNRQGYTQAAWWNRIPVPAWGLMGIIAICCSLLFGFSAHQTKMEPALLFFLPLIVSIAFFLIADLDSPHGGVIRVSPQNLLSLTASLGARQ